MILITAFSPFIKKNYLYFLLQKAVYMAYHTNIMAYHITILYDIFTQARLIFTGELSLFFLLYRVSITA